MPQGQEEQEVRRKRKFLGPRGAGPTKTKRLGCGRVAELGVPAMPVCWRNLCLANTDSKHQLACGREHWVTVQEGAKVIGSVSVLPEAAPPLGRGKCVRASKSLLGAASGFLA